ncbi:hypothetical protein [Bradyrhizobium sp.]|uniref:hypothetical protein n=1 Tax=Bradyrhizobium sp. TaxID=376 RepID=UPI0026128828|nr:hypothetical protein [Bradyrhizobium sp.]
MTTYTVSRKINAALARLSDANAKLLDTPGIYNPRTKEDRAKAFMNRCAYDERRMAVEALCAALQAERERGEAA